MVEEDSSAIEKKDDRAKVEYPSAQDQRIIRSGGDSSGSGG